MTNIFLFGSSTKTGQYINYTHREFIENSKIYSFSSKKKKSIYLDLKSYRVPDGINFNKEFIIISLAPIWLFVPYLESLLKRKEINKNYILSIIVTSSSSVITKKYSWNKFDNNLYEKLRFWEEKLIFINKKYDIRITVIRPTLIYDDIGSNSDKNINALLRLMQRTLILPFPKNTGLRQPIHFSQLGQCILSICKLHYLDKEKKSDIEFINLGGDEELTYQEILYRIKKNHPKSDKISCIFLKIPNRLFFLLCIPTILFSPKLYEAIQRIAINMHGFTKSHKISGKEKKNFPVKYN